MDGSTPPTAREWVALALALAGVGGADQGGAAPGEGAGDAPAWCDAPAARDLLAGLAGGPRGPGPLRLPVQDVYKLVADGQERRVIAGTVEGGALRAGDELQFWPSGKRGRVAAIEAFARPRQREAPAGAACGFTLEESSYLGRGEVACRVGEVAPLVARRLRATVLWLGRRPLDEGSECLLKLGTARALARLVQVHRAAGAAGPQERAPARIERGEVADCTFALARPLAFDRAADLAGPAAPPALSRFVLVEEHEVRGGGLVREALPEPRPEDGPGTRAGALAEARAGSSSGARPEARTPSGRARAASGPRPGSGAARPDPGAASGAAERAARAGGPPALLLLSGPPGDGRRAALCQALAAQLFARGRAAYHLRRGAAAALEEGAGERAALLARLGEVAAALLDAGHLVLASAPMLTRQELAGLRATLEDGGGAPVLCAHLGPGAEVIDAGWDLVLPDGDEAPLWRLLAEHGLLQAEARP